MSITESQNSATVNGLHLERQEARRDRDEILSADQGNIERLADALARRKAS